MRTVVTTVGTSLLGHSRRERRPESPTEDQWFFFLREATPEAASAETNSLSRLLQEGDRIVFLHSQTSEGRLCAQALRRQYESLRFSAEAQEVPDLTYTESRFKMRGFRSGAFPRRCGSCSPRKGAARNCSRRGMRLTKPLRIESGRVRPSRCCGNPDLKKKGLRL